MVSITNLISEFDQIRSIPLVGVRVIKRLRTGQLLIGAGDGTLELVEEATPKAPKNLEKVKIPSMPALRVVRNIIISIEHHILFMKIISLRCSCSQPR